MTPAIRASWEHSARWWLLLALLAQWSIAQAASNRVFVVELPVSLDTINAGKMLVGLQGERLVHIELDSWLAFARPHLQPAFLDGVAEKARDGRLAPEALQDAGISIVYDAATLMLTVALPTSERLITELSLRNKPRGAEISADPFSTYVNLRANLPAVLESENGASRQPATVTFDGAARAGGVRGAALEWSATYREGAGVPVRRGDVRLIHDDVGNAVRYSVGDVQFGGGELQGRAPWAGIAVERQYSRLQPFRVITTTGQQSFALSRPSRIDVFVNGQFQNTSRLLPGRYSLSDFAFLTGLNDVQIVVEDDTGQRTTLDFTLFLGAQLLAPGISEFAFSTGLQRRMSTGQIAYDSGEPGISGYYRRGVADWLTLSANYQAEEGLQVVGIESTVGTPIGLWSLNSAGSSTAGIGRGWAGSLGWTWNFGLFSDRRSEEFNLVGNYVSSDYRRLGQLDQEPSLHYQGAARLSTRLPFGTAISASWRYLRQRDIESPIERSVGFALSKQIARITMSLRGEQLLRSSGRERRAFLNMSMPLGGVGTVLAGYDTTSDQARVDYASFAQDSVGNLSGRAQVVGSAERVNLGGDIAYRANRALLRGQYSLSQPMPTKGLGTSGRTQQVNAQLETSFAYTDGSFAMGRPVTDSFALLRRHPSLRESEVQALFGRDGVIAEADDFGPALVSTLDSYRPQGVAWSVTAAPDGYDLGDVGRQVTPALYSGRAYTVGSASSVTALGIARYVNGEPLAQTAATISADDGRAFAPQRSFTNRNGRFAVAQLAPGQYRIQFATETPRAMRFTVPADAVGFVDVGVLVDAETDASDGANLAAIAKASGKGPMPPKLRSEERLDRERVRAPLPAASEPQAPTLRLSERLAMQSAVNPTGAIR